MPGGYCCRCRRGYVGRNPKPVSVSRTPLAQAMIPAPEEKGSPIQLDLAEFEALRLVELEKMTYDEAGLEMGVSRNTIWRLVEYGKEKLITAFLEARKVELHKS